MNDYEQKVEAKRERLRARADKAEAESAAQERRSRQVFEHIPMGQPVLVGHHSERRHRADLARARRAMNRAVEESSKAARLRRKAQRVGTSGISSDDPEAADKLRGKLEELEASRERMKAANAAHRRGGWEAVVAGGYLSQAQADKTRAVMESMGYDRPYPSWALSNIGSRIRETRKRLEAIEARAARVAEQEEPSALEGDGWRIEEDIDANRLRVYFDAKPPQPIRTALKRSGFRWARSVGAWQRHLSPAAWQAARQVLGG